jgi:serine/threonine-protein kinase
VSESSPHHDNGAPTRPLSESDPLPAIHLTEPEGTPTATPTDEAAGTTIGRYRIDGEIARGGMGIVLKGRDGDLSRDLAIKVLLEKYRDNPDVVRRFVEEAQVGGQLQHPGIVPIHELGHADDGRPYFTMKLVKGHTLAELLAERSDPAHDRPRFLGIFQQVCQTLAYAHSRKVIHRDLKPHNVMVGAFGEVQVMDWGLAKVLTDQRRRPEGPPPIGSVIQTVRSGSDPSESAPGSVLGTPAYMAPEQALGEVETLDERCDVFGLGAVLCEILTGQPPYVGADSAGVLRRAVRADLADALARLAACGAEPDLVALARDCLAAEPKDRPAHAGVVAERLGTYLAGVEERLRRAELERVAAQAKAEAERKRRRLTLALAASLMTLLALGGSAAWWYQRDRDARAAQDAAQEAREAAQEAARRAETERDVTAALREATALTEQGWKQMDDPQRWRETMEVARSAVERAEQLLARPGATEELVHQVRVARGAVDEAGRDCRFCCEVERIRLQEDVESDGPRRQSDAWKRYAAALKEWGVGAWDEREAERLRASRVREALLVALEEWRHEEPLPSWGYWMDGGEREDGERDAQFDKLIGALRPDSDAFWSRWRAALKSGDRAAITTLARQDRLSAVAVDRVARDLRQKGQGEEAERVLRAGLARYPNDFWMNYQLGVLIGKLQPPRPAEQARFLTVAVALRGRSAEVWNELGFALEDNEDLEGALAAHERAAAIAPDDPWYHLHRGNVLRKQLKLPQALAAFDKALQFSPQFGRAYEGIGDVLGDEGKWPEATQAYRKALEADRLLPSYLQHPRYHHDLGWALQRQGRLTEAAAAFREALKGSTVSAYFYDGLGSTLRQQGLIREALDIYRQGHKRFEKDPELSKKTAAWAKEAERLIDLEGRFPQILKGEVKPADAEQTTEFADLCRYKRHYAAAARFFAAALTANPKRAENPLSYGRYNAACYSVLAASGAGEDAAKLTEAECLRLRQDALVWLLTDLEALTQRLDGKGLDGEGRWVVVRLMRHWQQDLDLASVRGDALLKLPPNERGKWQGLWAEVDNLLKRAEEQAGAVETKP